MPTKPYLEFELDGEIEAYENSLENLLDQEVADREEELYEEVNEYLDTGISSVEDLNKFIASLPGHSVGAVGGNIILHKSQKDMAIDVFEAAYEALD